MDDNVMRVLQMLQDGTISAQEAEKLITALRGESAGSSPGAPPSPPPPPPPPKGDGFGGKSHGKDRHLRIDLDELTAKISRAVSRIEPEKIARKMQSQLRNATRSGVHWGSGFSSWVRQWTDGNENRPENLHKWQEYTEQIDQSFHLEPHATLMIENPFGNVQVIGTDDQSVTLVARKVWWSEFSSDAEAATAALRLDTMGTDSRLDVRVSGPDHFESGTLDLELHVPKSLSLCRVSTRYGNVQINEIEGRVEGGTTSGDVKIEAIGGDLRFESLSGNVSLDQLGGSINASSQSGNIEAQNLKKGITCGTASGNVTVKHVEGGRVECKSLSGNVVVEEAGRNAPLDFVVESVSGDVVLKEANGIIALKAISGNVRGEALVATRLQAQTVSGDTHIRLIETFSGTIQANSVSGDVSIAIPEGSNVRVTMSTTSGDMRCEHDAHSVTASERLWSGQVGTGAGTLNVQTVSGNTSLQRA